MAPYAPTYRYAVGIYGANYAQPDQTEPTNWIMCQTLDEAREYLRIAQRGRASWAAHFVETGDGGAPLDTPNYGEPGDGALIYGAGPRVAGWSGVLDEPGDRARHAFGYTDFNHPVYVASFGPRGGLTIERA